MGASLEQRHGKPAEEGCIQFGELLTARNTGLTIELSVRGNAEPVVLDFPTAGERDAWARYLELGMQVLVLDSERANLEEARARQRHAEMEARKLRNEERKKRLSDGLGMHYTAEAMMNRNTSTATAAPR